MLPNNRSSRPGAEPASRHRRGPRAGVGLLPILVTLALVALLAGLAIPAWFSRHEITLDNAALLFARDLRAAQNRAAFLGERARFVLDRHGWRAYDADGDLLTRLGSDERIERRLDADGVFEGVTLEAIRFGQDSAVEFAANGDALENGSVELHFSGEVRRVVLFAPLGRVEIDGLAREWIDDGR